MKSSGKLLVFGRVTFTIEIGTPFRMISSIFLYVSSRSNFSILRKFFIFEWRASAMRCWRYVHRRHIVPSQCFHIFNNLKVGVHILVFIVRHLKNRGKVTNLSYKTNIDFRKIPLNVASILHTLATLGRS